MSLLLGDGRFPGVHLALVAIGVRDAQPRGFGPELNQAHTRHPGPSYCFGLAFLCRTWLLFLRRVFIVLA